MTIPTLRTTLLAALTALALGVAGCGGDDDDTAAEPTQTPTSTADQAPPPAETSPETAEPATPAAGADKLTSEQQKDLLIKNNEAVLGEGGHVAIADNYRAYAEPLAEGKCKQALTEVAAAEEAFGNALDGGKPLAQRQKLGQQVLKLGSAVSSGCS